RSLEYASGPVMIQVQPLTNAIGISAGGGFGLARRGDGTVVAWGDNQDGQATGSNPGSSNGTVVIAGQSLTNVVSIAAGGSIALKSDGTVVAWGKAKLPAGLTNIVAISAHEFTRMAVKKDGTGVGWSI